MAKHGNSVASPSSSCPYIIPTQEEADARSSDLYYYGNVLVVDSFNYGRMGNRFLTLNKNLSVGYCCKSKLVSASVAFTCKYVAYVCICAINATNTC